MQTTNKPFSFKSEASTAAQSTALLIITGNHSTN